MERIFASEEPYWRLRKRQRLRINKSVIRSLMVVGQGALNLVDELWSAIFESKVVRQIEPGRFEVDSRLEDVRQRIERGAF